MGVTMNRERIWSICLILWTVTSAMATSSTIRVTTSPAHPPSEGPALPFSRQWPAGETCDAFAPGNHIVLLEDNPPAYPQLRAGQAGIIICRGDPGRPGEVLVSWISRSDATSGAGASSAAEPSVFPSDSAVWIDTNEVLLGRPFDQCGTLRRSPEGCILLETRAGRVYDIVPATEVSRILDAANEIQDGDRVRVRGLISISPPGSDKVRVCPQDDGDIYHPVITRWEPAGDAGCCTATMRGRIIQLYRDPEASNAFMGITTVTLQLDFRGRLAVEVTPMTGTAGTWQGFAVPELVGPGVASVGILLQAENPDLSEPPPDDGAQVAEVSLIVLPAD